MLRRLAHPEVKRRLSDERGVAMIIALAVLVVMLLLSAVVVSAAVNESGISNRDTKEKRAFEAAQAGLAQTTYEMNTVLNSSTLLPSALLSQCVGGTISANGTVTDSTVDVVELPATFYASIDCGPHTEPLGNGAFFTSWTSVVLSSGATCAGSTVGNTSLVADRCITSQGIICPPTYTAVSQLPCPNPVIHRVQERVAADVGQPVFPTSGVIGLNGVLIRNSAHLAGSVSTNKQLAIQQSAQVSAAANLLAGWNPIINNSALLGTSLQCNSGSPLLYNLTNSWPSGCVNRVSTPFTLLDNPPPYPEYTDDYRITNGLSACALANTCPHDVFSTSSGPCITCATWNATTRMLTIPNGTTWTISGGAYNLCGLTMAGSSSAVLANGVKTAIYIDSSANPSPSQLSGPCSGTGVLSVGNQAQMVNNSPPLPGSPLAHDTTALQLWVFGPSDIPNSLDTYNNNACSGGNDPTCVSLGQGTDFYGTLYAPTSDVFIGNQGKTYGGVAGRTVTYDNPGFFFQDANVPTLVTTATLAVYFRTAWTECTSQPTTATNPRSGC